MKPLSVFALFARILPAALLLFVPVTRVHASAASEVFEALLRKSPGIFDGPAEKAAARKAFEHAAAKYGDDAVKAVENGGLGLPKAAAKYGDDVWSLARLSPDAPRILAADADRILPIARRFGDDAARIEMKAPGCAEMLAPSLSRKSMRSIGEHASKSEIQHFAVLSKRLSKKELEAAARVWRGGGSKVLAHLTPAAISAYGFAGALIVASWKIPGAMLEFITSSLSGLLGPLIAITSWLLVAFVLVLFRRPLFWVARRLARLWRDIRSSVRNRA